MEPRFKVSADLFKRVEQTRNLPRGHIETKRAQEALDKVYALCHEVEIKWQKRLRRAKHNLMFMQAAESLAFCNSICDAVGERHIKSVTFGTVETVGAAGEYHKNEIRCLYRWADVSLLIHELTHHCGRMSHDKSFCDVEEVLFSAAYQHLTGKSPHADW